MREGPPVGRALHYHALHQHQHCQKHHLSPSRPPMKRATGQNQITPRASGTGGGAPGTRVAGNTLLQPLRGRKEETLQKARKKRWMKWTCNPSFPNLLSVR
ncbi:hypothetical protein E2C01_069396 [Portunus trituberculatus]|uniref:Uncharacterized protein n=1 Tax=Portunus trituberculatus TaxID=210409 RepID=A0A5B7HYF4_PORTR|nr:hypothetical protein [Portunus trituberculatus]